MSRLTTLAWESPKAKAADGTFAISDTYDIADYGNNSVIIDPGLTVTLTNNEAQIYTDVAIDITDILYIRAGIINTYSTKEYQLRQLTLTRTGKLI